MQHYNVIKEFQGGYTKRRSSTRYIVVHHAASLYRQPTGIEDVRAVAAFHTQTRGWPGIGYHICLAEETNGGAIARYNVSDLGLERAHVWGRNHEALGVSCLTNFVGMPEEKWVAALAETLRELREVWPGAEIVGHKEITLAGHETACPGPAWSSWKPLLLARVALSSTSFLRVKSHLSDDPSDNFAAVRQGPGRSYPEAHINGIPYRLMPNTIWEFDAQKVGWLHLKNNMGFVWWELLETIQK